MRQQMRKELKGKQHRRIALHNSGIKVTKQKQDQSVSNLTSRVCHYYIILLFT